MPHGGVTVVALRPTVAPVTVTYRVRFEVDDAQLSALHARAFAEPVNVVPWQQRLARHSVSWVGAFDGDALVGFVHLVWDGGAHAFLLDTIVNPAHQRRGIGRALVHHAVEAARGAGCNWLHVDFEPRLQHFYLQVCGFQPTAAGLVRLGS